MSEIYELTAQELVQAMRLGRIGVEEAVCAYLKRIEHYGGPNCLNAIAELNDDVLAQARRMDSCKAKRDASLFGLPILIKDNIDVEGMHTTAGSLALADNIAARDAHVVANLRRHGALILGKTNLTEFANYMSEDMLNGYSSRGGQVVNAYGAEFDPSGSSTGSAVAVSARLCCAALGTDTSFSIVGCATDNGVTGLKPPVGALSQDGIVPIAHTLDSAGPLTHTLSDALMIYNCMRDCPLPQISPMPVSQLRIAINVHELADVSDEQRGRYNSVLDALKAEGAQIGQVSEPPTPYQRDIMRCEFMHDLEAYLAGSGAKLRTLRAIVDFYNSNPERMAKYGISYLCDALNHASGRLDDAEYLYALEQRAKLKAKLGRELSGFDACIMTGPTNVMHFAGLPSIALKLGMSADGAPRGMILYGLDERRLISAALSIERYCQPVPMPQL